MPKETKTFILFLACPTDIVEEKNIVRTLCTEWNRLQGEAKNVRIEVQDWETHAYPIYGLHPQEAINQQVLNHADIVVGMFWTKFGFPTKTADSATEEEILLSIKKQLPLMLYFSDKPIKPSLLIDEQNKKVIDFKNQHRAQNLYWTFSSENEFKKMFRRHISDIMNLILSESLVKELPADETKHPPEEEIDNTGVEYGDPKDIQSLIEKNFKVYWSRVFNIIDEGENVLPNGMKLSKANKNKEELKALKQKLAEWEQRIKDYCEKLQTSFDRIKEYDQDELKNQIFAEELWTVHGALKNPERELDRYRHSFEKAEAYLIRDTIENILDAVNTYKNNIPEKISSGKEKTPDDFKYSILVHPPTLLRGVIGKGIRSEILHKYAPDLFTLMTRKSIWGLFYLTNESREFVVDDTYNGQFRTIHNYDYLYDHFTFYNYIIFKLLKTHLAKYKIVANDKLKYGYANLFLIEIERLHKKDIDKLKKPHKVNV